MITPALFHGCVASRSTARVQAAASASGPSTSSSPSTCSCSPGRRAAAAAAPASVDTVRCSITVSGVRAPRDFALALPRRLAPTNAQPTTAPSKATRTNQATRRSTGA